MKHTPSRIMLYVHFDRDNIIDPHIIYQLRAFQDFGVKIIFISNSQLPETETSKLDGLVEGIILRENRGYDWAAWRDVLFAKGLEFFEQYDELLLMNCTCYGPIFPLHEMFDVMDQRKCDFWMPTKHESTSLMVEHGQPYLLIVRENLFKSNAFWNYWREIKDDYKTFWDVVLHGEVRFTTELLDAGFKYSTYVELEDTREMPQIGFIEAHSINNADFLIQRYRLPLLKIKAFYSTTEKPFNMSGDIVRSIEDSGSEYPLELIYSHQRRCSPLSWQKNLPDTLVLIDSKTPIIPRMKQTSIAVLGHFFYPDSFNKVLDYLANIPCGFDLLATTKDDSCALEISRMAKEKLKRVNRIDVRVVPNRGRDAAPWLLEFRDEHLSYDIALKVQSKKHAHQPSIFGYKWNQYLFESMLTSEGYISNIIALFDKEEKLGIVFPTYPPIFNMVCNNFTGSAEEQKHMVKILKRLGLNPPVETGQPIFPTGLFWYRPSAFSKLLKSDISLDEFPPEPLPLVGTIAHGLERAIPYIVQGQGYYYKLAMPLETMVSSFQMYEDRIMSVFDQTQPFDELSLRVTSKKLIRSILCSYHNRLPRISRWTLGIENISKKTVKVFNKKIRRII